MCCMRMERAASTGSFLFFKNYPSIKPGTEIIVPAKVKKKNKLSTGEIIGISSALLPLREWLLQYFS